MSERIMCPKAGVLGFANRQAHLIAIIEDECICCDVCVETLVWAAAFIDATTSLVTHAIGADNDRRAGDA